MNRYCPKCNAPISSLSADGGVCSKCGAVWTGDLRKDPALATFLGLLFGPLGLLYVGKFGLALLVSLPVAFVLIPLTSILHPAAPFVVAILFHAAMAFWGWARAHAINDEAGFFDDIKTVQK